MAAWLPEGDFVHPRTVIWWFMMNYRNYHWEMLHNLVQSGRRTKNDNGEYGLWMEVLSKTKMWWRFDLGTLSFNSVSLDLAQGMPWKSTLPVYIRCLHAHQYGNGRLWYWISPPTLWIWFRGNNSGICYADTNRGVWSYFQLTPWTRLTLLLTGKLLYHMVHWNAVAAHCSYGIALVTLRSLILLLDDQVLD